MAKGCNLHQLACKFDLDQKKRKSSQVKTRQGKAWPNGLVSESKSTRESVWPEPNYLIMLGLFVILFCLPSPS